MDSLPPLSPEQLSLNRGPKALAADVVPRACALIAVALRFYARRVGGSKLSWDDWLILVVAIIFIPAVVVEAKMTELGLGRHLLWVIMNKPAGLPLYAKLAYFDQLVYAPMIAPIKCSILCLYIRLFGIRKSMRIACQIQIVLVIVWGLVTVFLFVFQCKPVEVAWATSRDAGTCFQYAPLFIGTNTVNVVMDFGVLITPLPSIWSLKLPKQKKAWVSAILMLGACESIFSATRLGVLSQLKFIDVTWDHADALIWSTVETAVGVLCACIPVLGPLLPNSILGTNIKSHSDSGIRAGKASPFVSYGSGGPRNGYAKFGGESPATRDTESEHELMTTNKSGKGANSLAPYQIQQTVDWEVRSEEVRSEDGRPHAV